MSAVLAPPPVDLEVSIRRRAAVVGLPGARSYVPDVPRRAEPRSRTRVMHRLASVLIHGMVLGSFAIATYVASGFAGSVELEAAHRQAMRSVDRANFATSSESGLRHDVERILSDDTVQRWATFNGFVPPYKLGDKPAL